MSSALQIHGLPGKRRAYAAKTSAAPRLSMIRIGNVVVVTAVTFLVGSPVYYHWFLDGVHVGSGTSPTFSFSVEQAGQGRVEVVDTLDSNFDPLSATIAQFPARYTVYWVRSLDTETREYLLEQQLEAGAYALVARLSHDENIWDYRLLSERLNDLSGYNFRVTPMDRAANMGTPLVLDIYAVRIPDAPSWNYAYDPGSDRVTFAAA